ncbi:MetS family NSS transporter small subunit [Siminovitchia terrae]|uniref:MetS family NSS transporter small subunit n=1 Tax=Siminovitchia terrae TaxID=1914933 RepID=UPI001BB3ACF0|nr:MetS family NSS transporter small subunit [Siminovitchia terrae]
MDAIVVMIFSIVLLWGGLGYFIFRFVKNRKFKKVIQKMSLGLKNPIFNVLLGFF